VFLSARHADFQPHSVGDIASLELAGVLTRKEAGFLPDSRI